MRQIPWEDPEFIQFASEAVQKKTDVLKLAEKLSKGPWTDLRGPILDYIALVPKYRKKFGTEAVLACDKLALEQSTAKDLGRYKAVLFGEATSIDDLCCGMGGDSFFISDKVTVRGVDLSPERVQMFLYNTKAFGTPRNAIVADVRTLENRSGFFTIDPARREKEGDNQRNFSELTPNLSEVIEIAGHYRGGMAKLPPGYPAEEIPADTELVYLGARNDCRECLVLFGELAKHPGKTRAVFIDHDGQAHEWISECDRSRLDELGEGDLGEFIAEPVPVLVRSHLFAEVSRRNADDAHLISPGIAYVASSKPLDADAFNNFKVLGNAPLGTSAVKKLLKAHDIGKITLKKRGVEIVPEAEIKRLSPRGRRQGILFYTRVHGEKTAILAEPL